ncbi:hypothetical protein L0U85_03745 [Glycomyces sp. L485]|uniref:hypothetical protein n=1 Tax=Glycomyces sp. L485 TaxID=2909235 RepID=UPI001F4B73A2|nr:hypothetical protein [Glycomyces sp. L485]MCH7229975.1 hypothetical protein [Glycomyces sp. L485]
MDALNAVSAILEWSARLFIPGVCAVIGLVSVLAAVYIGAHGRWTLTLGLAFIAALASIGAAVLTVRAVRRIRKGPTLPPIGRR